MLSKSFLSKQSQALQDTKPNLEEMSLRDTETLDDNDESQRYNKKLFPPNLNNSQFSSQDSVLNSSILKRIKNKKNSNEKLKENIDRLIDKITYKSDKDWDENDFCFEAARDQQESTMVIIDSKEIERKKALKIREILNELFQQILLDQKEEMILSLSTIYRLSDDQYRAFPENIKSMVLPIGHNTPQIVNVFISIVTEAIERFINTKATQITSSQKGNIPKLTNYYEALEILKYHNQWEIVKAVCKKFIPNPANERQLSLDVTKLIYENYLLAELKTEHSNLYNFYEYRIDLNSYFIPKNNATMGANGSKQQYYEILVLHNLCINDHNHHSNWHYIKKDFNPKEQAMKRISKFEKIATSNTEFNYELNKMVEQLKFLGIGFIENEIKLNQFSKEMSEKINKLLAIENIDNDDVYLTNSRIAYIKVNNYLYNTRKFNIPEIEKADLREIWNTLDNLDPDQDQKQLKIKYYYPEDNHKSSDCPDIIWNSKKLQKLSSDDSSYNKKHEYDEKDGYDANYEESKEDTQHITGDTNDYDA